MAAQTFVMGHALGAKSLKYEQCRMIPDDQPTVSDKEKRTQELADQLRAWARAHNAKRKAAADADLTVGEKL